MEREVSPYGFPQPMGDRQLVAEALGGDVGAQRLIFDRNYELVWRMSLAIALDSGFPRDAAVDMAEEITQATFLRVVSGLEKYRGDCPLWNWIQQICRNCAHDERRRRSKVSGGVSIDTLEKTDLVSDVGFEQRTVTHLDLTEALDMLPTEEREAFLLVKQRGYTSLQVARRLGIAETTVRSRVARARQKLARYLGGGYCKDVDR